MLPQDIEIFEAGALDDLSLEEIIGKLAPKQGETLYVTRLRSGLEVKISKERIIDLMQKKIELLDSRGVDIIGILCSGEFP
jgi:protein AroM